jgi:A/G-specific adenine glycosylase
VAQFYPSFLAEFPSSERLSTANPARLKKLGHRLGLEKRMSWLVRSAKMICQEHGGKVPNKLDDLTQLPGVGPYTASAVLCFGFGQDVPIVDANVVRVVTRIFGLSGTPKAQNSAIDGIAQKLVPKNRAVTYNEALLDFAATVCKKNPLCVVCPLTRSCAYCRKLRNENLKN